MSRKKLLQKFETKKLFYKKYPYKIACLNALACDFRGGNLLHVSKILDLLHSKKRNGLPLQLPRIRVYSIDPDSFDDACIIYNELQKQTEYQLRVEGRMLNIFSMEKGWLYNLGNKLENCYGWYEPSSLGVANPGEILLNKSNGYNYRVTLNGEKLSEDTVKWILNNEGNLKFGKIFKSNLLNGFRYFNGMYFYVKSEKLITLLNMIMFANIRHVDKVITKDKTA